MKILYLAHRIPYPPNKGDKVRAFHQIQHLAKTHEVHLACVVDKAEDLPHVETLKSWCASVDAVYLPRKMMRATVARAVFSSTPLSVAAFYSEELAQKIDRKMRTVQFDRVMVFSSAMAAYVHQVHNIPKIIDFVDADSEKWRMYADFSPLLFAWLYRMEAVRLARYEAEIARQFAHSLFVSEKEAEFLRSRAHGRPVSVISNGVNADYFSAEEGPPQSLATRIVFTGEMDYFPNVDAMEYFCQAIFPLIQKDIEAAQFYIVGRNPARRVRKLERKPWIIVTGPVPDVRPYLRQAQVAVAPFRIARGIQNKVLEAMAIGVPVVGSSLAFQGMRVTTEDGVSMADSPNEFAQHVVSLIRDSGLQRHRAQQARRYIQHHHRWQDHGVRLESIVTQAQ